MAAIVRATPMCVRGERMRPRVRGISGWLHGTAPGATAVWLLLPALLLLRLLARDWSSVSATAVAMDEEFAVGRLPGCAGGGDVDLMLNGRARRREVWALRGAPVVVRLRGARRGAGDRRAAAAADWLDGRLIDWSKQWLASIPV